MPADKYLVIDLASGRFHQQSGTVVSAGAYNAGEIVALDDDGRLDSSVLPLSGGIINPMTDSGDLIYGLILPARNLALYSLGARATANSSYHSSDANNTIDGNDATLHDGGGPVASSWIIIDLQAPTAIGAWRLDQVSWTFDGGTAGIGVNNEHADGYTLASSADGSAWTDRYTFATGAPDDTGIVLFGVNITARYWRVLAATGGNWGWDIRSFGLYQVEPAVARLAIGDELQVLTVVDGLPAWADAAAGSGLPPIGSEGQVLTVVGGVDVWADPPSGTLPAIGDEGQVLTVVSGVEAWADAPASNGGGAVIGGGPGIIDAIYDALSISNTDPIDTIVEVDDFVALIFLASQNTAAWKSATTSYTVPTGKKLLVLNAWATGLVTADSANRRVRLRNVTTAADVLDYTRFANAFGALTLAWEGDVSAPSALFEFAAGDEARIDIYNGDSLKRAIGAVVIMRLVPASGDYTPPLRGWSAAPGASLYLWGQYT